MPRRAPPQRRDSNGNRICRMPGCPNPIPPRRRVYCSKECAVAFEAAYFPSLARYHVFQRDRGVCALCGMDTMREEARLGEFRHLTWSERRAMAKELGFNGLGIYDGDRWQVDHIHPCCKGGWGTGLENLRTLCTRCHKQETAKLRQELAKKESTDEKTT